MKSWGAGDLAEGFSKTISSFGFGVTESLQGEVVGAGDLAEGLSKNIWPFGFGVT